MLQQVGYSLIDSSNNEVQHWGNSLGTMVSCPERVVLATDLIVEGVTPNVDLFDGYRIVERWIESNPTTEIDNKIGESIEFRADKIVVVYSYSLPEVEIFRSLTKTKLAAKRWQIETGGANIDGNEFATDRESQTKYTAVAVAISQADPMTWSINWKTNSGMFVSLNAQQMMGIINCVLNHVQNSFNKEYEIQQAIDSCTTVEEILAIDLDAGWPSNEYTLP